MIDILKGEIFEKKDKRIVVLLGNVGLEVWTPEPLLLEIDIGDRLVLYTKLILRENDVAIYGFKEKKERDLFQTLIKVNGVGPKAALSIISTMPAYSIYRSVQQQDIASLIKVPGIGKKTAQKIVLFLQDELKPIPDGMTLEPLKKFDEELLEALVGLGYSVAEAQTSIQSIPENIEDDLEIKLRYALQYFSG
jgi:Holliday junction DNA helicase RuvA